MFLDFVRVLLHLDKVNERIRVVNEYLRPFLW